MSIEPAYLNPETIADECLTLVQPAPDGLESATPLVLFHDGGGTSISYFYLGGLDRTVYALQNPHFFSGEHWEGGLCEMAALYARMICSVFPSGSILLGGWSLGGILSLEIASVLSRSSSIKVVGIVMIDSVFPHAVSTLDKPVVSHQLKFGAYSKPETQRLALNCMDQTIAMVKVWIPPTWNGCSEPEKYAARLKSESTLFETVQRKYGSFGNTSASEGYSVVPIENLPPPPQTVLLRCNEYVPVPEGSVCRVDLVRDQEELGWNQYKYDFITAVLDIPGNHFNIFDDTFLDDLTARVKLACRMLERSNL
ncbi:hypothetical protein FQN57_001865 [Myotisia sp. PD_48]|nr:hypothetical protein FQN57_001865 [Myotisia sp. PD_48]